jgi:pimeloyl-ACP methyl ester carboxylesterase
VDAAIKKGYSVLSYDRLGTGKSEKPNAYDVVQIPTEAEILASLTKLARSGKLISSSTVLSATNDDIATQDYQPSKIVQVGHAYSAFLIALVLERYGDLSDGAILTGLYFNTHANVLNVANFDHEFAREHDPVRFGEYPSGYFVLTTESDIQKLFFRKASLEPELLTYTEHIKQPETVGEYASEGTSELVPANDFHGPIQVSHGHAFNPL